MLIQPPFTAEDYLRAVPEAFMLPENRPQVRARTRASALAACARQQGYMMLNVPRTDSQADDPERLDIPLAAEEGRHFEDLSVDVLKHMGFEVTNRQIELPEDYPVSGHPDGELVHERLEGKWGFEHKHFGRYEYQKIYKQGLMAAAPEIVSQVSLYGDALGWDYVLILIVGKDASSNKGDARQNRNVKDRSRLWVGEDWNAKVQVFALDLRPLKESLVPRLHMRAKWLEEHISKATAEGLAAETIGDGLYPEYDPYPGPKGIAFPCSYCEWLQRCQKVGLDGTLAPALPFTRT
jgi:hypothetical protein